MNLSEGMDHALACNSSKGPRQQDDVERGIGIRQLLRGSDTKVDIPDPGLASIFPRGLDGVGVRVEPIDPESQRRQAKREAAVTAAEVEHALAARDARASPMTELDQRIRPERRRVRGDVSADDADRVAHLAE